MSECDIVGLPTRTDYVVLTVLKCSRLDESDHRGVHSPVEQCQSRDLHSDDAQIALIKSIAVAGRRC
jgi:hypothetical protein